MWRVQVRVLARPTSLVRLSATIFSVGVYSQATSPAACISRVVILCLDMLRQIVVNGIANQTKAGKIVCANEHCGEGAV